MRRKTMVWAGLHWFILVFCHIVLCSHSLRHHHPHPPADPHVLEDNEQLPQHPPEPLQLEDEIEDSSSMQQMEQMDHPPANPPTPIPIEVKVRPGHELKLKCDLNNTYGRIIWLLNDNSIRTDNGRYSIQGPNKNRAIEGRLTINNVLPEDNGIWQCHETKFDGKEHVSNPIRVVVLAAPRAVHLEFDGRRLSPSSPPMSSASPSSKVTYREKDNVSIQCVVEGGNPPPRVYWFLNSRNLTNNSVSVSEYLEEGGVGAGATKVPITRSTLRMDNISRSENNKSVLCVVDHELLRTVADEPSYLRAMAQFNIEYHPSFVLSRIPGFGYPIREGIAMALKCEVDANPLSRPIWLKDKGTPPVPQSDGFLNFTEVKKNHSGWYTCESHHPLGKFSSVGIYLTVRYEPTIIHQPPKLIEANVGERVSMKCGAEGTPSPSLCWSRIGYGGSLTTVGSGQELILDKILYQEAGSYRCTAHNRVNALEERRAMTHDVTLVVSGKPMVYPTNRTIMGFTGQPLSLSMELCANPMPERSFWIFGNTALRPGSKHKNKYVAQQLTKNDGDCYLAVLTILNVSSEDAGEYMFFVKNSKGIHEGTILLNITQASYSFSISSHTHPEKGTSSSSSSSSTPSSSNNNLPILLLFLMVLFQI